MRYFCGHVEAFFYAYCKGREAYETARLVDVSRLEDCVSRLDDIAKVDLAASGIRPPEPMERGCLANLGPNVGKHHVLVSGNAYRGASEGVVRHRWNTLIPRGGLYLVGSGIYMPSPEFIFLQLAGSLTDVQLALVGCWMCGKYRIGQDGLLESVQPLTTPSRLEVFLREAKGAYGLLRAKRVLKLVAAGTESPNETAMYAFTCFPRSLGGQGAPKATLNYVIKCVPEDAGILDRQNRTSWRIDMCWPELRKGVEYLGKQHAKTFTEDRERMNSLIAKKYAILQYEYKDLVDVRGRKRRMEQICRLLDMEKHALTPKEIKAQEQLEEELFGPAHFRL